MASMEERLARLREVMGYHDGIVVVKVTLIAPPSMDKKALDMLDEHCANAVFEALAQHGLGCEVF